MTNLKVNKRKKGVYMRQRAYCVQLNDSKNDYKKKKDSNIQLTSNIKKSTLLDICLTLENFVLFYWYP